MATIRNIAHRVPDLVDADLVHLAHYSGIEFFEKLCETICRTLRTDITIVGRINKDRSGVDTLAYYKDGAIVDNFTYDLAGTPCAEVAARSYNAIDKGVARQYPEDVFFAEHNIEAYAGFPLYEGDEEAMGLIATLSRRPFSTDRKIHDAMQLLAARARAELQNYIAQEQLQNALRKAHLSNSSKSMFLANISHELKNPLAAMIGFSKLIRDENLDPDNVRDYADEIYNAGESLLSLIDDIRSLATLEISKDQTENTVFDLSAVARTGRRMMQEQALARKLTMPPLPTSEPLLVRGDMRLTKKALLNLLSNAIKFTDRGKITMRTELRGVDEAALVIEDTGIGMSQEDIERVLRPIDDVKNVYSIHQDGSGLGIPLTMFLMEKQGARLEMTSTKGEGTIASLVFSDVKIQDNEDRFI